MKFFEHRSGGSVREMFILMGEMVKSEVVKKAQQASFMGLLIDGYCPEREACVIHQIC